jgi:hypothetical protein
LHTRETDDAEESEERQIRTTDPERRWPPDGEERGVCEEPEQDPPLGEKRRRNAFVESRLGNDAADAKARGGREGESIPKGEP